MNRRKFLTNSFLTTSGIILADLQESGQLTETQADVFRMKFSPEFGIFEELAGTDPLDQIRWGYDHGFRAWENTMLKNRPIAQQEAISSELQKLGMEFGQFVGSLTFSEVTFAGNDQGLRQRVLDEVRQSVEIAKRMNTRFIHNVLGRAGAKLPRDFQMANAIELLKRIAEIYEPHNLIMIMESMNHKIDHPGMFLQTIPQVYALAKAVDSPSIKVLFDFYHVQIEEGNLLPTLDHAWDEIAYLQMGDTPGRNEPTSGEINFWNCLQHVYDKGYRGFVGMEHGTSRPGKEGELKTLEAYRSIDPK